MKKQISVWMLLVTLLICVIAPVQIQAADMNVSDYDYVWNNNVSADTYQVYDVDFSGTAPSLYKPILVQGVSSNNLGLAYLSHEPFSIDVSHRQIAPDNNISYATDHKTAVSYEVKNANGETVHIYFSSICVLITNYWAFSSGVYYGTIDEGAYPIKADFYQALYDIYTGQTNVPGFEPNTPQFDGNTATLSSDIGYLQNVRINNILLSDSSQSTVITYNSLTSTGFNIQQDNVKVEARITVTGEAYYGALINGILPFVNPPPEIPDLSESTFVTTENLHADFTWDYQSSLYAKWKSQVTWHFELKHAYNFAVRVCVYDSESNSWKYGGWVRLTDADGDHLSYNIFDIDAGTEDSDGTFISDDINSGKYDGGFGYGYGDDLDHALDNIVSGNTTSGSSIEFSWSGIFESIEDFLDNLASLINTVGQFPSLFAKVFSFLPSHIINLVYAAIVMAVLLRLFGR